MKIALIGVTGRVGSRSRLSFYPWPRRYRNRAARPDRRPRGAFTILQTRRFRTLLRRALWRWSMSSNSGRTATSASPSDTSRQQASAGDHYG
jgi:hypothetical protein